jgi:hypothetical protein
MKTRAADVNVGMVSPMISATQKGIEIKRVKNLAQKTGIVDSES